MTLINTNCRYKDKEVCFYYQKNSIEIQFLLKSVGNKAVYVLLVMTK